MKCSTGSIGRTDRAGRDSLSNEPPVFGETTQDVSQVVEAVAKTAVRGEVKGGPFSPFLISESVRHGE